MKDTTVILRARFVKYERALAMQVMEQITQNTGYDYYARDPRELSVFCPTTPELLNNTVFLRGTRRNCDYDVVVHQCKDNDHRDRYANKVIAALTNWAQGVAHAEGTPPCYGDEVEVKGNGDYWQSQIFVAELRDKCISRWVCVDERYADEFRQGKPYNIVFWRHMRPVGKSVTMRQDDDVYTWERK